MGNISIRKVKRRGNSLIITLPIEWCRGENIIEKDRVRVEIIDGTLLVTPYKLKDALGDL